MHQNTLKRAYFVGRDTTITNISHLAKNIHTLSNLQAYSLHCKRAQAIDVIARVVVHIYIYSFGGRWL